MPFKIKISKHYWYIYGTNGLHNIEKINKLHKLWNYIINLFIDITLLYNICEGFATDILDIF